MDIDKNTKTRRNELMQVQRTPSSQVSYGHIVTLAGRNVDSREANEERHRRGVAGRECSRVE